MRIRLGLPVIAIALLCGAATMALQMAVVRLLAPWSGASSYVWASVIGLSLVVMSIGYWWGGRRADEPKLAQQLPVLLIVAAIWIALAPIVGAEWLLPSLTDALLGWSPPARAVGVASVGYLVCVAAPAMTLGMVVPTLIRARVATPAVAATVSGRVYAISTVGSIIGTLLTALVLLQWLGTQATFVVTSAVMLVAAGLMYRLLATPATASRDTTTPNIELSARASVTPLLAGIIVFIEGGAMMATEMSASRLIAPFFGASHVVWANLVAIIMGCIALGSWLGGRYSARWPTLQVLATVLTAAGVSVAFIPYVTAPVMRVSIGGIEAANAGAMIGSFVATMLVLVIPVVLLGMIPPWVIRTSTIRTSDSGSQIGRLYALSTGGALVGTWASVLWLIPTIGTRKTLLIAGGSLLILSLRVAAVGRRSGRSGDAQSPPRSWYVAIAGIAIGVVLWFTATGLIKPIDDGRVLEERESRYQFIQVVEQDDSTRHLQLNEGWAIHSVWNRDTLVTNAVWDHFVALPSMAQPSSGKRASDVLILGHAGGTASRALRSVDPATTVVGVEIDPDVTSVGRRWFGLNDQEDKQLSVVTNDARPMLVGAEDDRWDVIHIDAYRQPYIPFYLTTREFFALVKSRLEPGAVASINVGSAPADTRINDAIAATMRAEFDMVVRYQAEEYNEIIVAFNEPVPTTIDEIQRRMLTGDMAQRGCAKGHTATASDCERFKTVLTEFAAGIRSVSADADSVLTDNRAPVEWMTDRMLLSAAESATATEG